jgi:hypothetical protein
MPTAKLLTLVAVFFLTSIVSVVTGSTSLITVPVMISFGMEPRIAIATNMLTPLYACGMKGVTFHLVLRFRHIVALGLLCLWIGTPALACLPNPSMSPSEMECCKKMAGDCHMGTGQHPCCKTVSSAPASVASVQRISRVHPDLAVITATVDLLISSIVQAPSEQTRLGLPPPGPLGRNSILRI